MGSTAAVPLLLAWLAGCGSTPIAAVSIVPADLTTGLVAHWAFDETSGLTVSDSSGNHHDGVLTSGTWTPGRFDGGLRLAAGDTITISPFPNATPDWTVSVWVKLTKEDVMTFTSARAVLLTAEKGSMGGWEIEFDPRPGFDWLEASYFVTTPANDYVVLDCKCIETDRWLHFTAVFDSTSMNTRFSLYRDDVLVDFSALPQPILPGQPDLNIGRWDQGERPISGTIDDYAIWSRALTADEVAAINAHAVPIP
jgi:hypothetical protein